MSKERNLCVEDIADIENIIDYTFKQKQLLQQAFTRSSYANEHKEAISNEVLEFYGDRALDIIVTKELSKRLGAINENGQYATQMLNGYEKVDEGYLSMIRSQLVCKPWLSEIIKHLELDKYLIMGNSDSAISSSMKEDLFEAICGAMAIDCNWNLNSMETPILTMLNFEDKFYEITSVDPYVKFFMEWYRKHYNGEPKFNYRQSFLGNVVECEFFLSSENDKRKIEGLNSDLNYRYCYEGVGDTEYGARKDAIIKAVATLFDGETVYDIFPDNDLDMFKKTWLSPTLDNSINIIQEIEQAKIIKDLNYEFETKSNDSDGNPIWSCEGSFVFNGIMKEGWSFKSEISSEDFKSKTDAKKNVALALIKHIFETYHIPFSE